jgi:hypothetical protein
MLTCFVARNCLPSTYREYASARRSIARLACELLIKDLEIDCFWMRLFALELRGSFFKKSFHAFIAVFAGEGLRQEFAL